MNCCTTPPQTPPCARECLKTNENSYIANKTLTFQSAIQLPQARAWERGGFWDTLWKRGGFGRGFLAIQKVFNENLNSLNNYISILQNVLDGYVKDHIQWDIIILLLKD